MTQEIAEQLENAKNIQVDVFMADITSLPVEAIAMVITPDLSLQGRLNEAIFGQAGPELDEYMLSHIITPKEGQTYILPGFDLPAKHIIMAVMPHWRSDLDVIDRHLLNAVKGIVRKACEHNITEIAIPILCSGRGGYPKPRAVRLIIQGVQESISPPLRRVCFVCEKKEGLDLYRKRFTPA